MVLILALVAALLTPSPGTLSAWSTVPVRAGLVARLGQFARPGSTAVPGRVGAARGQPDHHGRVFVAREPGPTGFGWPVVPARVVRRFDPPARPWLAGHRGVDLAAMPSSAVRAAGAGTVTYVGLIAGRGVVSVTHPGGLRTTYEPVTPSVKIGAAVRTGATIGTLDAGHPGCVEPACLHWGLRRGDVYLDPLALLGLGRVRLLPRHAVQLR